MENQQVSKLVNEKLHYLWRICVYNLSLLILVTIVCHLLHIQGKYYSLDIPIHYLRNAYFFITIVILFVNHYIRKIRLFRKKPVEERSTIAFYIQSVSITLLGFNAIWIFGLILSMTGDELLFLYSFAFIAIILGFIYRPKNNELMKLIRE